MRNYLLALLLVIGLIGLAHAAVEVKSGTTVIGKTETIALTGPTVAVSGTDVTINTLTETGNKTITGNLTVTGVVVDTALYTASAGVGGSKSLRISADGTIYGF